MLSRGVVCRPVRPVVHIFRSARHPDPRRAQPAGVEAVEELLRRGGGLARRRDLLRVGMSRRALRRAVATGRLRPVTPHLYSAVEQPTADEGLRATALRLQAVVSHESAALLWGLELARTPDGHQVTVPRNRSRARHPGARVHRADLRSADKVERDGIVVTTVLRTVLDLCRSLPLAQAVALVDSALRAGLLTTEELVGAARALPVSPRSRRVAAVVALVDPRSGSVLESLCRVLLAQAGLRPEQTQLVVRAAGGRRIGRVDFAWPSARLVVEVDGFAFHADRAAYRKDRRRSNALQRAGWRVLRFSWEDVVGAPDAVVADVRAVLQTAACGCAAA